MRERDNIQAEFDHFQREMKHADKANTAKEIRILKKVVQNLEVWQQSMHANLEFGHPVVEQI